MTGFGEKYRPKNKSNNTILIGTAGGATRLSTGYTFLNIQAQSAYIRKNLDVYLCKVRAVIWRSLVIPYYPRIAYFL